MRLRRVETLNVLNNQRQYELPAGMFKGLLVRWSGTAAAQQTAVLADLGTIILRFRGKAIQNWRAAEAWIYTNLRGGRPEAVSNAGGAFSFSIVLPLCFGPLNTYNMDDNVLNVRSGDLYLDVPAVAGTVAAAANCDVCVLEDVGSARYITQIFSKGIIATGQERERVATPNLRHFMLTAFAGQGAVQPNAILFTRDNDVRVEGDWNELTALTDIDSMIEVGAAAVGAIMPDLGNNNPATWTGGRQECRITGAVAATTAIFVEFGAEPVTEEEHLVVNEVQSNAMAAGIASSPMPFPETVAPIQASKVLSANDRPTVPIVPPNREVAAIQQGPQPSRQLRRYPARVRGR